MPTSSTKHLVLFTAILVWVLLPIRSEPVQAEALSQLAQQQGTDVIFIVDQSGSMINGTSPVPSNCSDNPVQAGCPTDPDGWSLVAVRDGVETIFSRILAREFAGSSTDQTRYRVGLILFGDEAAVKIPLQDLQIAVDPTNQRRMPNVEELIPKGMEDLGFTTFSTAFGEACAMFGGNSECTLPLLDGRRRIVVLLTDGEPYGRSGTIESNYRSESAGVYFNTLKQTYNNLFVASELWVLGIDRSGAFWQKNQTEWATITGDPQRTIEIADPAQATVKFQDIADRIFTDTTQPGICDPGKENIVVGSYLSSVTFVFNYSDPSSTQNAQLYPPSELRKPAAQRVPIARDLTYQQGYYSSSRLSEFFIIRDPEPGIWQCTLKRSGVPPSFRKREQSISITSAQVQPESEALGSACKPFHIVARYTDIKGQPLQKQADFNLLVKATLQIDAQHSELLDMEWSQTLNGWRSVKPIQVPRAGNYPVELVISRTEDTSPLFSKRAQLSITPGYPCGISIQRPASLVELSWLSLFRGDQSIPLEVRLDAPSGEAIDPNLFTVPLSEALSVTVQGSPETAPISIPLRPSDTDPALYTGNIERLPEGLYRLDVRFRASTQQNTEYGLTPTSQNFQIVPDQLLVIFYWSRFAALTLAFMLALAVVGWFIYQVTGTQPQGVLTIETRAVNASGPGNPTASGWNIPQSIRLAPRKIFGLLPQRQVSIRSRDLERAGIKRLVVSSLAKSTPGVQVKVVPKRGQSQSRRLASSGITVEFNSNVRLRHNKDGL